MSKRILIVEHREWLLRLVEQAIREEQPDDEVVLASSLVDSMVEVVAHMPDLLVIGTLPSATPAEFERRVQAIATHFGDTMPPVLHISHYLSSEDGPPIFVEIDKLQMAVSEALAGEPVAAGRR